MARKNKKPDAIICRCNGIRQSEIEKAIGRGCNTLPKIFDATTAGVGPCGGSCRIYLAKMLDSYLKTGEFPEEVRPRQKKSN